MLSKQINLLLRKALLYCSCYHYIDNKNTSFLGLRKYCLNDSEAYRSALQLPTSQLENQLFAGLYRSSYGKITLMSYGIKKTNEC